MYKSQISYAETLCKLRSEREREREREREKERKRSFLAVKGERIIFE